MTGSNDSLRKINAWTPRRGSRPIGVSALDWNNRACCPPVLVGRPVYDQLPSWLRPEEENYYDEARILLEGRLSVVDRYYLEKFPWLKREYDSLGSFIGSGSGALTDPVTGLVPVVGDKVSGNKPFYVKSARIKWRDQLEVEFLGVGINLPENDQFYLWIDYEGILQITKDLPDRLTTTISTFFCDEDYSFQSVNNFQQVLPVCRERLKTFNCEEINKEKVYPLYRIMTENGVITQIEDLRLIDEDFQPEWLRYITEGHDIFLQYTRERINNFYTDYLNPFTLGYQYIPCSAEIRKRKNFKDIVLLYEAGMFPLIKDLRPNEIYELDLFAQKTHIILDWLAQHVGLIDTEEELHSYWHKGFGVEYNTPGIAYNLLEKRTLIANALTTYPDLFNRYPFNSYIFTGHNNNIGSLFGSADYHNWSSANWKGIQRMKGTKYPIHFLFDALGLNGFLFRTENYNTPLETEYIKPLRLHEYRRSAVSELPSESSINTLKIGDHLCDQDDRPRLRIPPYYERDSEDYWRTIETVNTYAPAGSIITGYYFFMVGKSAVGEPIYGTKQENGDGYEEITPDLVSQFTAGSRFATVVINTTNQVVNLKEVFNFPADFNPQNCKITIEQTNPNAYSFNLSRANHGFLEFTPRLTNSRSPHTYKITFTYLNNPSLHETTFLTTEHGS